MVQVQLNKVTVEILDYGKSMYGGWYANFRYIGGEYNGRFDGIRRDTLQELCNQLHISKTALRRDVYRRDN